MEQNAALLCAWPGLNSPLSLPAEFCSCSVNEVPLLSLSKSSGDPFLLGNFDETPGFFGNESHCDPRPRKLLC